MGFTGRDIGNSGPLASLFDFTGHRFTEKSGYYYHNDHIGSSSLITHNGDVIQKLDYLPFGELWYDKRYDSNWETSYTFSGKERDPETGLSYFGARYYDSETGIWISVDPLLDNYPSFSPYVYCANNPIKFLDPDGRENIPALNWARANMANKGIPYGSWFGTKQPGWGYKQGTVPSQVVCYDACFIAYMNSTDRVVDYLKETGFATKSGGFRGRLNEFGGISWFKNGNGTDRSFIPDISKGELGDIVFMGAELPNQGHAALLNGLPVPGSYTDDNGNNVETMTLNVLSTGSYTGVNRDHFGEKSYTFEKQQDGTWKDQGDNGYIFKGYGQLNSDFSKQPKTPGLE